MPLHSPFSFRKSFTPVWWSAPKGENILSNPSGVGCCCGTKKYIYTHIYAYMCIYTYTYNIYRFHQCESIFIHSGLLYIYTKGCIYIYKKNIRRPSYTSLYNGVQYIYIYIYMHTIHIYIYIYARINRVPAYIYIYIYRQRFGESGGNWATQGLDTA